MNRHDRFLLFGIKDKIHLYFQLVTLVFFPRLVYFLIYCVKREELISDALPHHWALSDALLQKHYLGFLEPNTDWLNIVGPSAFAEPLYPLFLAFARWISGDHYEAVILMQILFASLAGIFLYKLSLELSEDKIVAWVSVFLYAMYPYLIRQTIKISETSFLNVFLIMATYFYLKSDSVKGSILSGLGYGLAIVTRSVILPVLFLGLLVHFFKRNYKAMGVTALVAFLIILPMLVRNYRVSESFFSTRGGINLFLGNCKYSDKIIPQHIPDVLLPYAIQKMKDNNLSPNNEKEVDQFFFKQAKEFFLQNPMRVIKLKFKNALYFFCPGVIPIYAYAQSAGLTLTDEGLKGDIFATVPSRGPIEEWGHKIACSFILILAGGGTFGGITYLKKI